MAGESDGAMYLVICLTDFHEKHQIQLLHSAGMTTTTITHLLACHHQAEEGVVVAEGAMPIPLITMAMRTIMMIIMATTIMTTVVAMRTLTMPMKMCIA